MEYMQTISVPTIAVIVYWAINLLKYAINYSEKVKRLIPIIAGVLGAVLGIICFYTMPEVMPNGNFLTAIISGGASGLSATGINQMMKQLKKGEKDRDNKDNDM